MTGPGTNTYLVGVEGCVVIDPGPDDPMHVERILLETQGRIDSILVTHTHPDHSPAVAALARASGAEVLGRPPPAHGRQDPTFVPTRVLGDGDIVRAGTLHIRAVHTPGHASNHLCFLLEEQQLLFSGDHLMQGSTVVIGPPDGNMIEYLQSLARLQREPVRRIAPGHGLVMEDAQAEIARLIAHRLQREAKVIERLRRAGRATLGELVAAVYDDVDPRLHPVAKSSLLAHLLKLEEDGRAQRDSATADAVWSVTPDGDVLTAKPATGLPERLFFTVPDNVPVLVPGGPAGPVEPSSSEQPKRSKAIEMKEKPRKRYLDNPDKG